MEGVAFFSFGDNDSSSILTTSSSLSSGEERRLEVSYIDGVYHAIPLAVSHLEGEEEVDDATTISGSSSTSRAFCRHRRILAQEVDEKEEEEEPTRSLLRREGFQPVSGTPAEGASITPAVVGASPPAGSTAAPSTISVEPSVASFVKHTKVHIVEPHHHPYWLSSLGSSVTQAELDKLRRRFNVPRSILTRVPGTGELPHHACEDIREIAFPLIAFECGVRLPLAPIVRRLLSKFLLHPIQVASALWEHCLS